MLAAFIVACGRETPARAPDSASTGPSSGLGRCAGVAGRDSLCYHASRTFDFAGDGRPFRIDVDARGPTPDSLRVVLRVTRGDTVFHRAAWSSTLYGRYDAHAVSPDSARRRAAALLARLVSDSAFVPARTLLRGASDADAMLREAIAFDVRVDAERRRRGLGPGDTLPVAARESPAEVNDPPRVRALATELRDATAYRYFAGGEATYAVAWSPTEHRFVVVHACC